MLGQKGEPTLADAEYKQAARDEYASDGDHNARAVLVEDGPHLDADEEDDKKVEAEDPANLVG